MKNFDDGNLIISSVLINGGGMALNGAKLGDKYVIPGAIIGVLLGTYIALKVVRRRAKGHSHDRNMS